MKFLVSTLVLISTSAFACPNLAGKYKACRSTTGQSTNTIDIEMTQTTKNGITTFKMISTDLETNERMTETYIADGKTKIEENKDPETGIIIKTRTTTTCMGDAVKIILVPEIEAQEVGNMTAMLTKVNTQMIQKMSGQIFGERIEDTVICE